MQIQSDKFKWQMQLTLLYPIKTDQLLNIRQHPCPKLLHLAPDMGKRTLSCCYNKSVHLVHTALGLKNKNTKLHLDLIKSWNIIMQTSGKHRRTSQLPIWPNLQITLQVNSIRWNIYSCIKVNSHWGNPPSPIQTVTTDLWHEVLYWEMEWRTKNCSRTTTRPPL